MDEQTPMMKCGHLANAVARDHIRLGMNGRPQETRELRPDIPACAMCLCTETAPTPNLEGRTARCSMCGNTVPSTNEGLAFFQYRGEGSKAAEETCGMCSYNIIGCPRMQVGTLEPHDFAPRGAFEFDSFYDGCRGWD